MKLTVNGKIKEYPEDITILKLLEEEDITEAICVEVFLNGTQVEFENYTEVKLKENDKLEYIYLFASG